MNFRAALSSLYKARGAAQRVIVPCRMQVVHGNYGGYNNLSNRRFSIFNEFSKQLKGEADSNPEFQKSVKELNEKFGVVKEDLKVRTKATTEKLYKSVDEVWTEAETTSKKVSASVKEKISAAKEEVKETFGLGKEGNSGSQAESANSSTATASDKAGSSTNSTDQSQDSSSIPTLLNRLKSTLSSARPVVSNAFQNLKDTKVSNLAMQGYEIVKQELSSSSTKKRRMRHAAPTSGEISSTTDIVVLPKKETLLGGMWEKFEEKINPILEPIKKGTKPVRDFTQEVSDTIKDRWETSDSPIVEQIQVINDSVFGENANAITIKEIRRRDPDFTLPEFIAEVQERIKPVLVAYAKGDAETLSKYCTAGFIERCKAERQGFQAHGVFFDNKILHISEADVLETKILESTPTIVVRFQTQQIYCVRDKEGRITAGGKDTIQSVLNLWALQLIDPSELGKDAHYPEWLLCEMSQHNFQALI